MASLHALGGACGLSGWARVYIAPFFMGLMEEDMPKRLRGFSGLTITTLLLFVASPTHAQEATEDPCTGVSCSGHGTCRVIDESPACACEEGFAPDASGLNCVATAAEAQPEADSTPAAEDASASSGEDTGRLIQRGRPGYALWLSGLLLEVSGLSVAVVGSALYYADPDVGIGTATIVMWAVGGSAVAGGIALLVIGLVRMRRDRAAEQSETASSRLTVAPLIAATGEGGVFGLSGAF